MSLLSRFDEDLKAALKRSESVRLSVLRLVKAAVKNRQIEKGRELDDEEVLSVLSTLAKQRRESIDQYSRCGREDLADRERDELSILQSYMPAQLTPEQIDELIRAAVTESEARDERDIGKVMRLLVPRIKGVADGKQVNERIRELMRSGRN